MSPKPLSIRTLIKRVMPREKSKKTYEKKLRSLQEQIFHAQRALYTQKKRLIIVFEGIDAAGKGGTIRRLSGLLDPRGVRVHAIGPPEGNEQKIHWLYRFWMRLPKPGVISIFDRSWYGRVLVEYVELGLTKSALEKSYRAINDFERTLSDDGIRILKIYLAISKDEQRRRFEERLTNPFKQWKLGPSDIKTRRHFDDYMKAADQMVQQTSTAISKWHVVAADHKYAARIAALEYIASQLKDDIEWARTQAHSSKEQREIRETLKMLKSEK